MGAARRWINKEALASVPPSILGTRIWLTAIWASCCSALHGFNSANINGIMSMKAFKKDFGCHEMDSVEASNTTGWVTSAILLGQLAGVMLSRPVNERRGRRVCIGTDAVLYTIGAVIMSANFESIAELLAGRIISGLGSGFGMTTGTIYISEMATRELRGCLSTFHNVNIMAGVTSACWITYGSLLHIASTSSWQWRVLSKNPTS